MPERPNPEITVSDELAELLRTPFDGVLADPNRLRIQASLHGLPATGSMRFTALSKTLRLSDGNLSAHLSVLAEVGYVTTSVTFTGKRRTTWYAASATGREAFDAHVRALTSIVSAATGNAGGSLEPGHDDAGA